MRGWVQLRAIGCESTNLTRGAEGFEHFVHADERQAAPAAAGGAHLMAGCAPRRGLVVHDEGAFALGRPERQAASALDDDERLVKRVGEMHRPGVHGDDGAALGEEGCADRIIQALPIFTHE